MKTIVSTVNEMRALVFSAITSISKLSPSDIKQVLPKYVPFPSTMLR